MVKIFATFWDNTEASQTDGHRRIDATDRRNCYVNMR